MAARVPVVPVEVVASDPGIGHQVRDASPAEVGHHALDHADRDAVDDGDGDGDGDGVTVASVGSRAPR